MIDEEQKELSDYIKSVHLSLRCKSRQLGAEQAWKEHVKDEEVLRNYAVCMKNLAENHWSKNKKKDNEKLLCRIEWMITTLKEYFKESGLAKEVLKEKQKLENFILKSHLVVDGAKNFQEMANHRFHEPYKLLDIGSCFDPFRCYSFLKTYAIDLYPATSTVKKGDFTRLRIEDINENDWFCDNLEVIPKNFFDIVVFSLFLEYLPSPEQRYLSCEKAYEALKKNGLLLIATPDSKHESANAGLMKSWKIALARIGFVRIKLDKLKYLYCMSFRKAVCKNYPLVLYGIRDSCNEKKIHIPQDSVNYEEKEGFKRINLSEKNIVEGFQELPFS